MKGTKFWGIGLILMACILTLLLAGEIGFTSVAWAKKPPDNGKPSHRREYRTEYGYAMLRDGNGDVIKSDGLGQYKDCTLGGEDLVQIDIYNDDNSLRFVDVYAGKMTYHHPDYSPSSRRVNFHFNIHGGTKTSAYEDNKAVYDILRWYRDGDTYVERSSHSGFLDDNSVHASIFMYVNGKDKIQFMVDAGHEGTDPKAITQAAVDAFYDDDVDGYYWDTSEYDEGGQIIYTLRYGDNGFDVVPIDWEGDKPVTWVITTKNLEPVKLTVCRYSKVGKGMRRVTCLSEYSAAPFQFTVSLKSLTQLAPKKDNNLSSSWGKIKVKE